MRQRFKPELVRRFRFALLPDNDVFTLIFPDGDTRMRQIRNQIHRPFEIRLYLAQFRLERFYPLVHSAHLFDEFFALGSVFHPPDLLGCDVALVPQLFEFLQILPTLLIQHDDLIDRRFRLQAADRILNFLGILADHANINHDVPPLKSCLIIHRAHTVDLRKVNYPARNFIPKACAWCHQHLIRWNIPSSVNLRC